MVRVLLVDDDRRFAEVVRGMLDDDGYDVVGVVGSVAEAVLAAAAGTDPDVVVADLLLPDGDAIDAAEALRAGGVAAPVVVFSPLFARHLAPETMAQGYGYVEKAAGIEALKLAIESVIDLREARDALHED